jgi:uncharacterized protein DUF262
VTDQIGEIAVHPEIRLLEWVLQQVAEGKLRVPIFQRPFVWRPDQMRNLFDSIERGYPIGSLLIWETETKVPSLDRIADLDIPAPPRSGTVSYLLDGHQRVSTLLGCLWRRLGEQNALDSSEWKWRLYRVLGQNSSERERYFHWKRPGDSTSPPPEYLPMRAVLRTMDFLAYSRQLLESRPDAAKLVEEAEDLAQRVKSYQVAQVRLEGGDLSHAVEAFSRLNTTGQMMTPDQMVSALTYRQGGDTLAEQIAAIREGLGSSGYGQVTPIMIFRTILAVAGEEDVQATRWEALAARVRGGLAEAVENTKQALQLAIEFLRGRVGVPLARLVPYQPQTMLLGAFFHHRPQPSARQLKELQRWFWGTSWSGHFAGANTTEIKNALRQMRDFAKGDAKLPWDPQPARPFPNRFDLRSARVRAFILWELHQFPARLDVDGKTFMPVEVLARSDNEAYRHVVQKGVANLSHPANRLILPTEFKVSVRRALLDLPDDLKARVVGSHGIPLIAMDRLRAGDEEGFIAERAETLINGERAFMAKIGITPAASRSGDADVDTE